MKALLKILLILVIGFSFGTAANAQEDLYNKLNARLASLYKSGKTEEAIKVAEKALKVAEETFGEKHPYVSSSLNNLALLYTADAKFEKAEACYEKSLKIAEEHLAKNDPHIVNILENMIKCNEEMGKMEKVRLLEAKLDDIR